MFQLSPLQAPSSDIPVEAVECSVSAMTILEGMYLRSERKGDHSEFFWNVVSISFTYFV